MQGEEKNTEAAEGRENRVEENQKKPTLPAEEKKKLVKSMLLVFLAAAGVGILLALVTFFAIKRRM